MLTPLLIEIGWYIVLASAWGSLLLSRRLSSGLVRAWVAFLVLGLWYGYRGAEYAWAFQWSVYVTGILLLWAWLALEDSQRTYLRWHPRSALVAMALLSLITSSRPLPSFSLAAPDFTPVALLWTQSWAPLFALLSVVLAGIFLLLALAWRTYIPPKSF
jgi:hypothetical protein